MSKFVQISKNHQDMANTPEQAVKAFNYSCNICSSRGMKLDCDRCPIKNHHELVMAVFVDLKEYDEAHNDRLIVN